MAHGTTMAQRYIHPTYDPSIHAEAEEESVYFYQNFLIGKSLKDIPARKTSHINLELAHKKIVPHLTLVW